MYLPFRFALHAQLATSTTAVRQTCLHFVRALSQDVGDDEMKAFFSSACVGDMFLVVLPAQFNLCHMSMNPTTDIVGATHQVAATIFLHRLLRTSISYLSVTQ